MKKNEAWPLLIFFHYYFQLISFLLMMMLLLHTTYKIKDRYNETPKYQKMQIPKFSTSSQGDRSCGQKSDQRAKRVTKILIIRCSYDYLSTKGLMVCFGLSRRYALSIMVTVDDFISRVIEILMSFLFL